MADARPRVVVITGASSGIGEATARLAASQGWPVVLAARRKDRLDEVASDIERAGGSALPVECDVTNAEAMSALVARTIHTFGRIDVMIANAGIGYHGPFETTPESVSARLIAVNLMGTVHAAKAAMVEMKRQGTGHIVVVSSIVGRRGIGGSAVYSATKAAQVAFVEALRAECMGTGIHASVVLPVSTVTEFHQAIERDFGHRVAGRGPRQSAEVVAAAIVRCIQSPTPELYPYRASRLLAIINVLAPGLTDRIVQRFRRRQLPSAPS